MAALFGANRITKNDSSSSPTLCAEGVTFSAAAQPKTVVEAESCDGIKSGTSNKKRKNTSIEIVDGDCTSIPILTPEAEVVSELELELEPEPDVDVRDDNEDNAATTDRCDDFEWKKMKRRRKNNELSDLIVVLDMDECLIHFRMEEDEKENQFQLAACDDNDDEEDEKDDAAMKDRHQYQHQNQQKHHHPSFMYVNEHKVLLRPGSIEFLKYVTARFETHIFTAGTKEYADSILDQLCLLVGNRNAFSKRWYRKDCDTIDILDPLTAFCIDSIYVKPLSKVAEWAGRDAHDLRRIVHIDDQARNFLLNHGNGIRVSEWRGDNPNDRALSEVTKILQKIDCKNFGDVRPHLRNESYLTLKDQLDMMNFFPHRRTHGIGSTLL